MSRRVVAKGVAEGLKKSAENTAIASKDPDEAAATVARVQREPAASPARVQREPGDASLLQRARDDAILLQQQGKIEEAIEKWRSIANLVGEEDRQLRALAWFAIGSLHSEGEGADLEASLDAYTRGIALNPAFAEAYYTNRAPWEDLNRHADAIGITARPSPEPGLRRSRGIATLAATPMPSRITARPSRSTMPAPTTIRPEGGPRRQPAIADYKAIAAEPDRCQGPTIAATRRTPSPPADAIADYSQAIALNPTHAGAYNNRGIAEGPRPPRRCHRGLQPGHRAELPGPTIIAASRRRPSPTADAIADYSQAIALNPALAGVYYNRGNAKREGGRINEAREDYQRALNLAQEAGDENIVMRAKHRLSRRDNNEAS